MATNTEGTPSSRCQHKGCVCDVEAGREYCSDFCEKASAPMANLDLMVQVEPCKCGHPKCGTWEETAQRTKTS